MINEIVFALLCIVTISLVVLLIMGIIKDYQRENYDPWTGGRKYNN